MKKVFLKSKSIKSPALDKLYESAQPILRSTAESFARNANVEESPYRNLKDLDTVIGPDGITYNINKIMVSLAECGNAISSVYPDLTYFYNVIADNLVITFETPSMATDGLRLFVNPAFYVELMARCGLSGVVFVLIHEIYHNLFTHVPRMKLAGLDNTPPQMRANVAADLEINWWIAQLDEDFKDAIHKIGACFDEKYAEMTMEDIYAELGNKSMQDPTKENEEEPDDDELIKLDPDFKTGYAEGWNKAIEEAIQQGLLQPTEPRTNNAISAIVESAGSTANQPGYNEGYDTGYNACWEMIRNLQMSAGGMPPGGEPEPNQPEFEQIEGLRPIKPNFPVNQSNSNQSKNKKTDNAPVEIDPNNQSNGGQQGGDNQPSQSQQQNQSNWDKNGNKDGRSSGLDQNDNIYQNRSRQNSQGGQGQSIPNGNSQDRQSAQGQSTDQNNGDPSENNQSGQSGQGQTGQSQDGQDQQGNQQGNQQGQSGQSGQSQGGNGQQSGQSGQNGQGSPNNQGQMGGQQGNQQGQTGQSGQSQNSQNTDGQSQANPNQNGQGEGEGGPDGQEGSKSIDYNSIARKVKHIDSGFGANQGFYKGGKQTSQGFSNQSAYGDMISKAEGDRIERKDGTIREYKHNQSISENSIDEKLKRQLDSKEMEAWRNTLSKMPPAGKSHADFLGKITNMFDAPKLNWKKLLKRYLIHAYTQIIDKFPKKKWIDQDRFKRYEKKAGESGKDIIYIIDNSGSMGNEEFGAAIQEVNAIVADIKVETAYVAQSDTQIQTDNIIILKPQKRNETIQKLSTIIRSGAGGTDFTDAFDWVTNTYIPKKKSKPEAVIVITDGIFDIPPRPTKWADRIIWVIIAAPGDHSFAHRLPAKYGKIVFYNG